MPRIKVGLPKDRSLLGVLQLESDAGELLAGPFPVCSRADGDAARRHGNLDRDPLLPFGDTPTGDYRASLMAPTAADTTQADQHGPHGIVVLKPTAGAAALADANGRFHLFIQGGAAGRRRRLRATNGSLRLSNRNQRSLVAALRSHPLSEWRCVIEEGAAITGCVDEESRFEEGDPPPLPRPHLPGAASVGAPRAVAGEAPGWESGAHGAGRIGRGDNVVRFMAAAFSAGGGGGATSYDPGVSSGDEPATAKVPYQPSPPPASEGDLRVESMDSLDILPTAAVTPAAGALAPSADFGVSSGSEPGTVNVPYQPPSPPPPPEMRAPDGTEPRSSSPESDDGGHLHNEPPEIEGPSEGPEVPE